MKINCTLSVRRSAPRSAQMIARMERETGIEPATSSLGSRRQGLGQRRIKRLERAEWAIKGHYWFQSITVSITISFPGVALANQSQILRRFGSA